MLDNAEMGLKSYGLWELPFLLMTTTFCHLAGKITIVHRLKTASRNFFEILGRFLLTKLGASSSSLVCLPLKSSVRDNCDKLNKFVL